MRHLAPAIALAVLLLLGAGCAGRDPLGRLLRHQDAVVTILERHAADPAAAGDAVTAYLDAHRADLDRLGGEARDLEHELRDDPRAVADLALDHQEAIRSVGERLLALRQNTALLGEPRVRAALDAILRP